jgi:hypothetical protein
MSGSSKDPPSRRRDLPESERTLGQGEVQACPYCAGFGKDKDGKPCERCGGTGKIYPAAG